MKSTSPNAGENDEKKDVMRMGSVKKVLWDDSLGGQMFRPPTPTTFGRGVWDVSGFFSVGDFKDKIPRLPIPGKPQMLAMTAGRYWEMAANAGFVSVYEGMLSPSGDVISVEELMDRGDLSSQVVMRLAYTPHDISEKLTHESRAQYHQAIRRGLITIYVADAECIFRSRLPLGSTTWKRIFRAAGRGEIYEKLSMREETEAALDEIRQIPGILTEPKMVQVLGDVGLDSILNPGCRLPEIAISFNSKFDPGGDKDITYAEAQEYIHLDRFRFQALVATLLNNGRHQVESGLALPEPVAMMDGKTEILVVNGIPCFTDFAWTMDEGRPMIRYQPDPTGPCYLIPTSKEIGRGEFRKLGLYNRKEEAIRDHGDEWLEFIYDYISPDEFLRATQAAIEMMAPAIAEVSNRMLGRKIFDVAPIESWVEPFLPFSSIERD